MPVPDVEVATDIATEVDTSIDPDLLERAAQMAIAVGLPASPWRELTHAASDLQLGLRVTDDDEMRRLNRTYRNVDRSTDVLSFSALEGAPVVHPPGEPLLLGEIVFSYPKVVAQATDLGHSTEMELAWLTIHGALQLLGYTHESNDDASRMEAVEREALASLGFSAN